MVCDNCGERFLEDHDAFDGKVTVRLAKRLVADAQVMPIRAVARRHGVDWSVTGALVLVWSDLIATRRRRERFAVLLVDETSMRKRRRYVTVNLNGDTVHALGMVPHRDSAALVGFLMSQPHRWRRGIKDCRHRRVTSLQDRCADLCAPRPPRARPVPRHTLVHRRSHRGAPRCLSPRTPLHRTRILRQCSKHGSSCCGEATRSPTQTKPASTSCSTSIPDSKPATKPSKNSTASTSSTTKPALCKP